MHSQTYIGTNKERDKTFRKINTSHRKDSQTWEGRKKGDRGAHLQTHLQERNGGEEIESQS